MSMGGFRVRERKEWLDCRRGREGARTKRPMGIKGRGRAREKETDGEKGRQAGREEGKGGRRKGGGRNLFLSSATRKIAGEPR